MNRERKPVYAVLRFDLFLADTSPLESLVTVKEIVGTQEEAEQEVERLNALVKDGGARYAWQATRLIAEE
jgi:hypothetical protein